MTAKERPDVFLIQILVTMEIWCAENSKEVLELMTTHFAGCVDEIEIQDLHAYNIAVDL